LRDFLIYGKQLKYAEEKTDEEEKELKQQEQEVNQLSKRFAASNDISDIQSGEVRSSP